MFKKIIKLTLLLITVVSLAACGVTHRSSQKDKGLSVVTSFYPMYAMTKEVSGDLNQIKMIRSTNGIHSFEPSVNDVSAIYDADLFIYHSHTLESWARDLHPNLKKSKVAVFEASKSISLRRVQGLEDVPVSKGIDPATLYDPHTWTDPRLVGQEAQAIAKKLSELDPKNKDYYEKNAAKFVKKANALEETYQKKFATCRQKTFVTQHTAFSYLAHRFGLKQLGISGISNEQEPSPRQLSEIHRFVKEYKVKTIFAEDNVSPKTAQTIAKATGAKVKTLSPLEAVPQNEKSYLDNLELNMNKLYQQLKKEN
ncbi:metal ABC transporter solute-binding protein, Zn/Mn family [Streptococcus hongkongensis]|nr:adhesion protein [Streptococcus uberis]